MKKAGHFLYEVLFLKKNENLCFKEMKHLKQRFKVIVMTSPGIEQKV